MKRTQPRSLRARARLLLRARSELTNRPLPSPELARHFVAQGLLGTLAPRRRRPCTRGRMALSATRGLRCKPSASRPSLGPSLHPWPPDGPHTHRGLAGVHEVAAVTPPGSADIYPAPHGPLTHKVPDYGTAPREQAAPLLLKDITEDASTCASAVRVVTCGCPVM